MMSLAVLPNPTLLEVVSIEVDEAMNMITACATTISAEARCPLGHQSLGFVHFSLLNRLPKIIAQQ